MSFLKSKLDQIKSKHTSAAKKRTLLKEVQKEARDAEREKVKLEAKAKEADAFVKAIENAKKKGAKQGRIGNKTYTINALINKGRKAQKVAKTGLQKTEQGLRVLDKALGVFVEPTASSKSKKTTKRKVRPAVRPKVRPLTKPKVRPTPLLKKKANDKTTYKYVIQDIKTGKKGTFNAKTAELAMTKAVFVLRAQRSNLQIVK